MMGPNDDRARLVRWLRTPGEHVRRGQPVCEVETTKAIAEIEAESDGYLVQIASEGASVRVGEPLAALTDSAGEDITPLLAPLQPAARPSGRRWTRKAELLATRMNIDLEELATRFAGQVIGETELLSWTEGRRGQLQPLEQVQRVMVLGSAKGGAAALILDALARIPGKHAVGVLDRDPSTAGMTILGVPVVGSSNDAVALWKAGRYDAAVIAFNRDLDERASLFEDLRAQGVPFTNVIDVTADVGQCVTIGIGNVILACCHIGPYATIGDNNFLSTNTCIEHHCRLGSHCAFGPAVAFSGRVTVGNKVRFGTLIAVEPDLDIGSEVIIASGCVLTRSVPSYSTVKARADYTIRPRELKPDE
jgi:sugar O-acyltransferase (sialic acid O-acetyltransferase NeuD family)